MRGRQARREAAGAVAAGAEAGADREVVLPLGRGADPHERGRLPARLPHLLAERRSLLARIMRIQTRLVVAAGTRAGRVRGYPTAAERHAKTIRIQAFRTRLADVEQQLESGRVSVCRGGKALARKRHNLTDAGLTEGQWREQWDAARMFITADGEKDKTWGNETIRWNPDQDWLEIRLPPRWRTWRTDRTGVTGSPVPSGSPIGAARSPRRPRPARSATTSPWTSREAAGTSTHHGRPRQPSPSRWARPGRTQSSPWT